MRDISCCVTQLSNTQVSFGESHKVVGGHPSLGDWDVGRAPQMKWNDGNIWTVDVELPEGSDVEFKASLLASISILVCSPESVMMDAAQLIK